MFEIGREYRNRNGYYQVIDIKGNNMTINQNGETKTVDRTLQERILKNIELEEFNETPIKKINFEKPSTNEEIYKIIGFLANNGVIFIELIEDYKIDFFEKYQKVSNKKIDESSKYIIWRDKNKLWTAPSIRVNKNKNNGHVISYLNVPVYENDTHYMIYKMDFIWYLIEMGFCIGEDHNIEEICKNVPNKYKKSFLSGYIME